MGHFFIEQFMGFVLILSSILLSKKESSLRKTGIRVDGVVFQLIMDNDNLMYPMIRFLTLSKEWITERVNVGGNPSPYKEGQKVKVIYDALNPKKFIIDSYFSRYLPTLLLFVGILLLATGIEPLLKAL